MPGFLLPSVFPIALGGQSSKQHNLEPEGILASSYPPCPAWQHPSSLCSHFISSQKGLPKRSDHFTSYFPLPTGVCLNPSPYLSSCSALSLQIPWSYQPLTGTPMSGYLPPWGMGIPWTFRNYLPFIFVWGKSRTNIYPRGSPIVATSVNFDSKLRT